MHVVCLAALEFQGNGDGDEMSQMTVKHATTH